MALGDFIRSEGRALPVFLLVDVSGSMQGQKISTVNVALKEMMSSFRKIENPKGIIELCILAFGGDQVTVVKNLSKIEESDSYTLSADGRTPMGLAFEKVADMVQDENIVSSRAYTPTIVLISDGNPTDYSAEGKSVDEIKQWPSLSRVHNESRISRSVRLAMGIGDDMNSNVLRAFINDDQRPIIMAKDNDTIAKFFEWVTMSVSIRSVSSNPNSVQTVDPDSIFARDEMEF